MAQASDKHILHVVGARPNIMKVGPLYHRLAQLGFRQSIIHTGQHYDPNMASEHFEDFGLPMPRYNLEVGAYNPARQFGEIVVRLERVLADERPHLAIVYGDVRSTPAAAICAYYCDIPVCHYEAGLRTFDRIFPEEFNRIAADAFSALLITTEPVAHENVVAERKSDHNVFLDGDLMCDAVGLLVSKGDTAALCRRLGLGERFAVMTAHRHCNVDERESLGKVVEIIERVTRHIQLFFSVHPRTAAKIREFGFEARLRANTGLVMTEPLRYRDFILLVQHAQAVVTDSGGLIAECVHLKVPQMHLHHMTEHPLAVEAGCVVCCALDADKVERELVRALAGDFTITVPTLWDGRSSERIAAHIAQFLGVRIA